MSDKKYFELLENRCLLASPLGAPTVLKVTTASSTAIAMKWVDNATAEVGFKIERSTDGGATFAQINTVGPNTTTYANGKLVTGRSYYYRVRAYDAVANSKFSNRALGIPLVAPSSGKLPAPTNLKAKASSATGIGLTWTDNANTETGYRIERGIDGKSFKPVNSIGANQTSYANGKLATGTKYYYRVAAFNASGIGSYSNIAIAVPATPPSTPAPKGLNAPSGMKAVSSSATAINLTWSDNATAETGFRIERSIDEKNFKEINTIGANQKSYLNGKLTTGVKYYFRVRAFNPSGNGVYSSIVSAVPIVAPDLAAPTTFKAVATSPTTVKLTWTDVAKDEDGYKIERSLDGVSFTEITNTPPGTTIYGDDKLLTGTKYHYRVRAYDEKRFSAYTEILSITPKAGSVVNPTDLPPVTSTAPDFASGGKGAYETDRWFFDGVSVTLAADPAAAIPILKDLHVGSVRTWFNKEESWAPQGGGGVAHAKAYSDAGFRVMMVVGDDKIPTYDEAKTFFKYVKNYPDIMKYVDLFEIGNEPNRPNFWKGTASEYVNIVLKAAWDVFHPAGAKVVGAGATFDVNYCKILVEAGYLNYVDYANFHPYGSTPDEVYQRALGAKQVFAGRPLLFSEWNIRNTSAKDAWAAKNNETRALLATVGVDSSFYFTFVVADTLAGPSGLINLPDLSHNEPFYDMFKGWDEEAPIVP